MKYFIYAAAFIVGVANLYCALTFSDTFSLVLGIICLNVAFKAFDAN